MDLFDPRSHTLEILNLISLPIEGAVLIYLIRLWKTEGVLFHNSPLRKHIMFFAVSLAVSAINAIALGVRH